MTEDSRRVLRPSDVAAQPGRTTNRVYQLIAEGVIPAIRIKRSILIPAEAWEEWLRQRSREALAGDAPAPPRSANDGQDM